MLNTFTEISSALAGLDFHRIGSEAVTYNVLNAAVDFLGHAIQRWDGNDTAFREEPTPDLHQLAVKYRKAKKFVSGCWCVVLFNSVKD